MWPSTGIIMPLSTGAAGRLASAASIHSASAVRGPFDELQGRLPGAPQAGVEQLLVPARDQVETVARSDFPDVDLGRERGEIFRRDLRAGPGRAKRPIKPVAARPMIRSGAAGGSSGFDDGCACDWERRRAWVRIRSASAASVGAIAIPVTPPLESGASRAPATGAARPLKGPRTRGSDAQATVLHSNASAPALFQPGRGQAGASERRSGWAWLGDVNTGP